jgi:NAD+-dependent secondary alcohol dehydrogenase Adh1
MAELLRTSVRSVVKLDEGLAPADVAALADAGLTAYHAVRKALPLLYPGAHAVVIGAGGLGHIGLQTLLAITAAEITVVDRSADALAKARALGVHHTVLAESDHVAEIMEITHGTGGRVVFDFVGEHGTEAEGIAMTSDAGSYYVIGYGGHVDVPTIDIISREISIVGNLVGSYNDLAELMTLTTQGKVRLSTKTYQRSEALAALDDLDGGRIPGTRAILIAD